MALNLLESFPFRDMNPPFICLSFDLSHLISTAENSLHRQSIQEHSEEEERREREGGREGGRERGDKEPGEGPHNFLSPGVPTGHWTSSSPLWGHARGSQLHL